MKKALIVFAALSLFGCESSVDNTKTWATPQNDKERIIIESAKAGAATVENLTLTEQVDGGTYLVEMKLAADPITSGANDWNSVAQQSHRIAKALIPGKPVSRIHVAVYSPENKGVIWANIWVNSNNLSANWESSYLLFFKGVKADPGTTETTAWLCDFYRKYETARPNDEIPKFCK